MVVAAASMLPDQRRISRHIPVEIVEEILLNLPVKSLLRFSTVSKSWNSIISHSQFIRRHKSRATLLRRENILICHSPSSSSATFSASTHSLSSLSSNQTIDGSEPILCPFEEVPKLSSICIHALCDEMCCVGYEGSLFLWNPSMRTYRKLPRPFHEPAPPVFFRGFHFGLGFDSSSDDYKILKVSNESNSQFDELYSLRSDSWKKIQSFPLPNSSYWKGVFTNGVCGAVHCMVYPLESYSQVIISFDFSTEKYAEVAPPPYSPEPTLHDGVQLTVLREKLCVHLDYGVSKFVSWVMQEYGVEKSWTKMFEIDYNKILPYTEWSFGEGEVVGEGAEEIDEEEGEVAEDIDEIILVKTFYLVPLCFYDNGEVFFKVENGYDPAIIMHINEESTPQIVFRCRSDEYICELPYVESLISPATYCSPRRRAVTPPAAATVGEKIAFVVPQDIS